jgi:hypothetical protein
VFRNVYGLFWTHDDTPLTGYAFMMVDNNPLSVKRKYTKRTVIDTSFTFLADLSIKVNLKMR